jgi:hypothetical protein
MMETAGGALILGVYAAGFVVGVVLMVVEMRACWRCWHA